MPMIKIKITSKIFKNWFPSKLLTADRWRVIIFNAICKFLTYNFLWPLLFFMSRFITIYYISNFCANPMLGKLCHWAVLIDLNVLIIMMTIALQTMLSKISAIWYQNTKFYIILYLFFLLILRITRVDQILMEY